MFRDYSLRYHRCPNVNGIGHVTDTSGKHESETETKQQEQTVFSYTPLDLSSDSIRVLRILPGASTTDIECVLTQIDLEPRTYSCLSYAWGSSTEEHLIILNGAKFYVRANLWEFLWQARETGFQDALWIDAICIDQDNIMERNHQVQRMSRIYKLAREVIVWLGPVPSELQETMCENLSRLAEHGSRRRYYGMPLPCLKWIRSADYWSRAWILPEIFLAATLRIMIGCRRISFDQIRIAFLTRYRLGFSFDRAYLVFWCWSPRLARRRLGLALMQHSQCLHPRDRVYSMIGIVPALRGLKVRYDVDASVVVLDIIEASKPATTKALDELADGLNGHLGTARSYTCLWCTNAYLRQFGGSFDGPSGISEKVAGALSSFPALGDVYKDILLLSTKRWELDDSRFPDGPDSLWRECSCKLFVDRLLDWSRSQRPDDTVLLVPVMGSAERTGQQSYWWKKDGRVLDLSTLYSHEVLPA